MRADHEVPANLGRGLDPRVDRGNPCNSGSTTGGGGAKLLVRPEDGPTVLDPDLPKSPGCIGAKEASTAKIHSGPPSIDVAWRRSAGAAGLFSFSVSRSDASVGVVVRPVTTLQNVPPTGWFATTPHVHASARPTITWGFGCEASMGAVVFMASVSAQHAPGVFSESSNLAPDSSGMTTAGTEFREAAQGLQPACQLRRRHRALRHEPCGRRATRSVPVGCRRGDGARREHGADCHGHEGHRPAAVLAAWWSAERCRRVREGRCTAGSSARRAGRLGCTQGCRSPPGSGRPPATTGAAPRQLRAGGRGSAAQWTLVRAPLPYSKSP